MNTSRMADDGALQGIIRAEMKRDRLVQWISILAWVVTFIVLIGFGAVIGGEVLRTLTLARVGVVQQREVLQAMMPLFTVVGITSLLLALVSTALVFLRQRTASLADIQIRLAALESMLSKDVG